jgi:hypothetical protein
VSDNIFAAHSLGRLGSEIEAPRHGELHAVRRGPGRAPAVTVGRHHLVPVLRILRNVSGLVDLIEFGGVFRDKAVRLDEIGKHVVAWPVAADAPFDVEPIPLDPAGAAHQPVNVRHFVGDVIERGSAAADNRYTVMVGAAAQKFHHVRAVRAHEAEHVDEKRHLLVRVSAVEHDVADLGRARAIEDDVGVLGAIRRDAHRQSVGRLEAEAVAAAGGAGQRRRIAQDLDVIRLWPWRRADRLWRGLERRSLRQAKSASAARGW